MRRRKLNKQGRTKIVKKWKIDTSCFIFLWLANHIASPFLDIQTDVFVFQKYKSKKIDAVNSGEVLAISIMQ